MPNTHKVVYLPDPKKGPYWPIHISVRPDLASIREFPSMDDAHHWAKQANAQWKCGKSKHYLPE